MDVWVSPCYQDPRYSVPGYSPMDHSRSVEVKALGRLGKEDPLVMDLVVLLCYQDPCFGHIGDALHWEALAVYSTLATARHFWAHRSLELKNAVEWTLELH